MLYTHIALVRQMDCCTIPKTYATPIIATHPQVDKSFGIVRRQQQRAVPHQSCVRYVILTLISLCSETYTTVCECVVATMVRAHTAKQKTSMTQKRIFGDFRVGFTVVCVWFSLVNYREKRD